MSKIEDALNKAKSSNKTVSIAPKNIRNSKGLVKKQEHRKSLANIQSLIHEMQESELLTKDELETKNIITTDNKNALVTDRFRELRTQLLQLSKGENFVLLVVTVDGCKDGDFVSINIGASFALDENKTSLVVDCNAQSMNFEQMLELNGKLGLSDYISDQYLDVGDVIYDVGLKRLRVVPIGVNEGAQTEYFTSTRMKKMIDDLVVRYQDRYIVLNGPPINHSADAKILIDLADYVILVVPYGKISTDKFEEAISKIDSSKLAGVVLNNAPV